jgi:simple sugar transport system ATP-binding protein
MTSPPTEAPLLGLHGLSKSFGSLVAVDGVDFDVHAGEVHALLGENGAGKSTLMNLLFGLVRPDVGEIRVRGDSVSITSPADAIGLGIGMVHQHFKLAGAMTVAENISMLLERNPLSRFRARENSRRIERMAADFGIAVDPGARVDELSVGEQQRVEILKLLVCGADVLILDEPTGVLTPPEWEQLRTVLLQLRAEGKGIVFISHKLQEVLGLADRCTVLRKGAVVGTWGRGEADAAGMARAMVGRDVHIERRVPVDRIGGPVLELQGVTVFDGERPALDGVDLTVRAGEIHGIAGVDGNGQDELLEIVLGIRPVDAGSVHLAALAADPSAGERYDARSFLRSGGGVVPADRHRYGVAADLSVATNLALNKVVWGDGATRGVLQGRRLERWAAEAANRFDVRVPSLDLPVAALSGGNQQKVVLAREIGRNPDILVAAQPTRGLDVGAVQAVYGMLAEYVGRGGAVLLISAELDELLSLADRISVMAAGRLSEPIPAADFDRGRIGLMMAGERA